MSVDRETPISLFYLPTSHTIFLQRSNISLLNDLDLSSQSQTIVLIFILWTTYTILEKQNLSHFFWVNLLRSSRRLTSRGMAFPRVLESNARLVLLLQCYLQKQFYKWYYPISTSQENTSVYELWNLFPCMKGKNHNM